MRSDFTTTTIAKLIADGGASIKTGPFGTTLKASEYGTVGVPLISVGEIGYGSLRIHDKTPRVSSTVTSRLAEYVLEEGDIVFGRKGAVDRSARIAAEQHGWFLGSDGIRLRLPDTTDSRFMAFQMQSLALRNWILQHATGTTMASLNQDVIGRIPVSLPPLAEQRRIAHVLGTLDDKIELNRKMNRTLEDMAQALFKSWFIDFDGHDDLVDSELGPIPRGWSVAPLANCMELAYGKSLPEKVRRAGQFPVYGSGGISGTHDEPLVRGPGVIVGRKGSVGTVYWEDRDFCPIDTTFYVVGEPSWLPWCYLTLVSTDIARLGADSAVPGVNRNALLSQRKPVPPAVEVSRFTDVFHALRARVRTVLAESGTLTTLRDTLLPKLISGELRVPAVEAAVETAL